MKKRTVIKTEALPTRMPLLASVVLWLLLDRIHAPGWAWGTAWTMMALVWIAWGASIYLERSAELPGFGEEK